MLALRYNTASQVIALPRQVDDTDGYTEETALTIANTDIKLWKTGATTLANKNSGGATHIANGVYYCTLDATDTNTLGPMVIYLHPAGARFSQLICCVYPAVYYDSVFLGTDYLQVDQYQISGSTSAATRNKELLVNAVNGSTVAASPAPTSTQFAGGLTGASYPDNCFKDAAIVFTSGSNAGLTPRVVNTFVSSTGLFTMKTALPFTPVAGDTFDIVGVAS